MATKFVFNKAELTTSDDWNYETVGQLKVVAKGYRLKFTRKNLKNSSRRLAILLSKTTDFSNPDILTCTVPLSNTVRQAIAKGATPKAMMRWLLERSIQQGENKDGEMRYFLFSDGDADAEMLESYSTEELNKVAYEDLATF
jgi:hypothetical protein